MVFFFFLLFRGFFDSSRVRKDLETRLEGRIVRIQVGVLLDTAR